MTVRYRVVLALLAFSMLMAVATLDHMSIEEWSFAAALLTAGRQHERYVIGPIRMPRFLT